MKMRYGRSFVWACLMMPSALYAVVPEVLGPIDSDIYINDMTPNGETIVGKRLVVDTASDYNAVKWHLGEVSILATQEGNEGSALAINQSGSFISGEGETQVSRSTPVIWDASGSPTFLPFSDTASILQANAVAVNDAGTRVAISGYGTSGIDAFLYQIGEGFLWSADMNGWSGLYMSADGTALTWGYSETEGDHLYWHDNDGFTTIEFPRRRVTWMEVDGISTDGSTVFGRVIITDYCDGVCGDTGGTHSRPFYWSKQNGPAVVPWRSQNYSPRSISDDGKVMLIRGGNASAPVNLIWHQAYGFGLRDWDDVMQNEYQVDWAGWADVTPLEVSGAGSDLTFVGVGNLNGVRSIWRVRVDYDFANPAPPVAGKYELISKNIQGFPSFADSTKPAISQDGNIIAFVSEAYNLDSQVNQYARGPKVFVRDQLNNTIKAISLPDEQDIISKADSPSVSGDGNWVAYTTGAQAMMYDHQADSRFVVSMNDQGVMNTGYVYDPELSYDGRYLVYSVYSLNMTPEVPSAKASIVLYDRIAGTTQLISKNAAGEAASNASNQPDVSDDGRYIVYVTASSNIVGDERNTYNQIVLYDRNANSIQVISAVDGVLGNGDSSKPVITGDGRFVSYISKASNLFENDVNSDADVFVYDTENGSTQLASSFNRSPDQGVVQESGGIAGISMSDDGRFVAFQKANDIYQEPTFYKGDIFVRDLTLGMTFVMDYLDDPKHATSYDPVLLADGSALLFRSSKKLIEPDLSNYGSDIVKVAVPYDKAPSIEILQPQNNAELSTKAEITLEAIATDEDVDINSKIVWSSSIDGDITSPVTLSPGDHVLTARVTDQAGQGAQAEVNVTVRELHEADLNVQLGKITTAWYVVNHDLKLTVSNGGPETGTDVVVSASLLEGARFLTTDNDGCQVGELTAICTLPDLEVGAITEIVYSVELAESAAKNTLTVTVDASTVDPVSDDNASTLRFGGAYSVFTLAMCMVLMWSRRHHLTRR